MVKRNTELNEQAIQMLKGGADPTQPQSVALAKVNAGITAPVPIPGGPTPITTSAKPKTGPIQVSKEMLEA